VLVDDNGQPGVGLDILRPVGVLERVQSLVELVVRRRDVGDHRREAVAAERVLEEACELRVAVGHVGDLFGLVGEGIDAVAQREQ